jgi:hypothetical protein
MSDLPTLSEPQQPTLEQQLVTANESVTRLTLANVTLTKQLSEAESRNKKLKRNSRNEESSLRTQLATAQSRRG